MKGGKMKNRVFNIIMVIIICVLIGIVAWQQIEIKGIKSRLTLFAEFESALIMNERLQQAAQNLMLMCWADSGRYLAMGDMGQSMESLNEYEKYEDELITAQSEYDNIMTLKLALLKWEK